MKRLDRLVYVELVGPWIFGVAIFTSLVFATTLLMRMSEWVVRGVEPATILTLAALLTPGIMVKTFAMALLLASLLAFGRLSNDSEIVALRAAGASLHRIMQPVLVFSLSVAVLAFALNETVVPWASQQAIAMQIEIEKQLSESRRTKPVFHAVYTGGRLAALVTAKDFNLSKGALSGVHIVAYERDGEPSLVMLADQLVYNGPQDWRIVGAARMISVQQPLWVSISDGAWPPEVARPDFTPKNLLAGFAQDLDVLSMSETWAAIQDKRKDRFADPRQIANLEFGFYNKIALPLAAVIFALLGAPLGIRNHRTGVGAGFALSVLVSFLYLTIVNFLAVYSKNGAIPPWMASFAPLIIGIVAATIAIARKNG
ncbi:MAG: LptF/LptG family permease [Fimbriimonadaceae bacterium]